MFSFGYFLFLVFNLFVSFIHFFFFCSLFSCSPAFFYTRVGRVFEGAKFFRSERPFSRLAVIINLIILVFVVPELRLVVRWVSSWYMTCMIMDFGLRTVGTLAVDALSQSYCQTTLSCSGETGGMCAVG